MEHRVLTNKPLTAPRFDARSETTIPPASLAREDRRNMGDFESEYVAPAPKREYTVRGRIVSIERGTPVMLGEDDMRW